MDVKLQFLNIFDYLKKKSNEIFFSEAEAKHLVFEETNL